MIKSVLNFFKTRRCLNYTNDHQNLKILLMMFLKQVMQIKMHCFYCYNMSPSIIAFHPVHKTFGLENLVRYSRKY